MTAFDAAAFQALRRGPLGADLRCYGETTSTQDLARTAADQGAVEGCAILAEAQAAGRGRWGRRWQGRAGQSLLFTVLLDVQGRSASTLPLLLGLASAEALRGLGLADAGVKWPNDLWAADKKLGGLLLETHGPWVLAGCGINVGQGIQDFEPEIQASAGSLKLLGLADGREAVLAALLSAWGACLEEWKMAGFGPFLNRFEAVDALLGRPCTLRSGGQAHAGRYLGISPDGALRLGLVTGQERLFQSAEIEQVRPATPD
jgi:BirA family biotin operon repressor/biotin-[acetyl-CoA-carboxylase] ligase